MHCYCDHAGRSPSAAQVQQPPGMRGHLYLVEIHCLQADKPLSAFRKRGYNFCGLKGPSVRYLSGLPVVR
jgi:hypothetical protein